MHPVPSMSKAESHGTFHSHVQNVCHHARGDDAVPVADVADGYILLCKFFYCYAQAATVITMERNLSPAERQKFRQHVAKTCSPEVWEGSSRCLAMYVAIIFTTVVVVKRKTTDCV